MTTVLAMTFVLSSMLFAVLLGLEHTDPETDDSAAPTTSSLRALGVPLVSHLTTSIVWSGALSAASVVLLFAP